MQPLCCLLPEPSILLQWPQAEGRPHTSPFLALLQRQAVFSASLLSPSLFSLSSPSLEARPEVHAGASPGPFLRVSVHTLASQRAGHAVLFLGSVELESPQLWLATQQAPHVLRQPPNIPGNVPSECCPWTGALLKFNPSRPQTLGAPLRVAASLHAMGVGPAEATPLRCVFTMASWVMCQYACVPESRRMPFLQAFATI